MNIINSKTAQKLRPIMQLHMDYISNALANPEQFVANGYWLLKPDDDFYSEKDNLSESLTDEEETLMIEWLTHWLNTYGWDIVDDEKIIPYVPAAHDTPATTGDNQ